MNEFKLIKINMGTYRGEVAKQTEEKRKHQQTPQRQTTTSTNTKQTEGSEYMQKRRHEVTKTCRYSDGTR